MKRKLTREEIEYGMKEFIQGLLIGAIVGFLMGKFL